MSIVVEMHPDRKPVSWGKFCKITPEFSIAIDGYVNVGPRFQSVDDGGPRLNLNHHEEVDREATCATCMQMLRRVRVGLFSDSFRDDCGPKAYIWANDCDQDVATSIFIARHNYITESAYNPRLNELVSMEDLLDTFAGAYPFHPDLPLLGELAWVFEPYTEFRMSGGLETRSGPEFLNVVDLIDGRIMAHINGQGKAVPLNTDYKQIGGGDGWALVIEKGAQARTKMFHRGIRAFISVRERADGRYTYTVGKTSEVVPFPVSRLLAKFNEVENNPADPWGGGNTVGGSGRISGSVLTPDMVQKIANETLTSVI